MRADIKLQRAPDGRLECRARDNLGRWGLVFDEPAPADGAALGRWRVVGEDLLYHYAENLGILDPESWGVECEIGLDALCDSVYESLK